MNRRSTSNAGETVPARCSICTRLLTFARETLQLVYGKKTYEGKSATEVVFTWLLVPDRIVAWAPTTPG